MSKIDDIKAALKILNRNFKKKYFITLRKFLSCTKQQFKFKLNKKN